MDHKDRLVAVTGGGRLDAMDWGDVQPYVMFMTGRCGSTWLTELLAATGLAGNPDEWLNPDRATHSRALAGSLPGYFANLVGQQSSGGRFGMQVDAVRLRDTLPVVEWDRVFPSVSTPTFFLYRRDIAAQAWSWVHARKSGIWHSTSPAREDRPEYAPTMRELADEVVLLRRQEEYLASFWAEHGYEPMFIEYETLAADPAVTVAGILRHLGVAEDEIAGHLAVAETKVERLTYDASRERELRTFRYGNMTVLAALERDRFGVGSGVLDEWLARVEPIAAHLVGADSVVPSPLG
ncbi:Stf0 family sulfotransferase [Nocardioides sp. T2.26MG-1]|uniref:Stf0 family sulfotransferase n=1 Tax=Nocardioides sp. T2.26MG-1 TaxID=3041166 RepID=UPI00247760F1|nr:Stf0 family sulfotransferase [Nocardioides sp. T2.26MG-1]CAI9417448.1 hypothetical protein HIDPHFAB_03022 [Nocardioides sp. T2.26MG-1]